MKQIDFKIIEDHLDAIAYIFAKNDENGIILKTYLAYLFGWLKGRIKVHKVNLRTGGYSEDT